MVCNRTGCASSSCPTIRASSRQIARRRRALCRSARTRHRPVGRRKEPASRRLTRTQPGLPLKKGRAGTMTHDYERHGATTLFAAMNVLDGTVIGRNMQRHRHQEFDSTSSMSSRSRFPLERRIHAIVDNYAAHKHPNVRRWLRTPSAMDLPFHPDIGLLAQRRRGLLRNPHKAKAPSAASFAPSLTYKPRSTASSKSHNQPIEGLHLDRRSRQNHRRSQARAPRSVRFDPH